METIKNLRHKIALQSAKKHLIVHGTGIEGKSFSCQGKNEKSLIYS